MSVPLDCPDTCSLTVTVEDERIVSIRGSRANPYTAGVLCAKVPEAYPGFVHGEGRLRTPLRRVGAKGEGRFERISWAQALDHRPRALHAGDRRARPAGDPAAELRRARTGCSPAARWICGSSIGSAPACSTAVRSAAASAPRRGSARSARCPGIRPEQAEHAKLIVAWGSNVTWSNLHFVPIINRARRAGGKLVIVDPRRTKIAEQADLHVALRPGTDVVLAWAMAAELERQGALDRAFIARHVDGFEEYMALARRYTPGGRGADLRRRRERGAAARRVVPDDLAGGRSPSATGSSATRTAAAASARSSRCPALAGKFGVPGGGLINGASFAFPKTPARLARPDLVPAGTRMLNIIDVGRHLTDPTLTPPIKALFIYNHNPVVVHPDQNRLRRGLEREDLFVVGSDVVMTDSLAYADVVLPACSHFEHPDLFAAYGTHWLQRAEPVIPPQGEALPNTEIFRRLAARFGFTDAAFRASDAELMDDALDPARPAPGRQAAEHASRSIARRR